MISEYSEFPFNLIFKLSPAKLTNMADIVSGTVLPLSRVKTIMKSSPDVSSISQEALFTTGKATVCNNTLKLFFKC